MILIVCTIGMFSQRFNTLMLPNDVLVIFFGIVLAGIFLTSLSLVLNLIALKVSRKIRGSIFFIPFLISYVSAMAYIFLGIGDIIYLNPFNSIQLISMSGYLRESVLKNYPDYTRLYHMAISGESINWITFWFNYSVNSCTYTSRSPCFKTPLFKASRRGEDSMIELINVSISYSGREIVKRANTTI
ncbi:MAG: hypothetical protein N3D82_00280 [Ignisphaera sp.]|nr:hypothetical protein [Ignisphaera sp.]MDW8084684.1 hypothetical protein [Ignisphaera sp.]